jgi:hypothetical protein
MTAADRRGNEHYYRPPPSRERMIREGGEPWPDTIAYPWYTFGFVQARIPLVWLLTQGDDVS